MTLKTLALATATAVMLSGAAFAQSSNNADTTNRTTDQPIIQDQMNTNSTTGDTSTTNRTTDQPILNDNAAMAPFYTDESMTTLRTGDEFRQAYNSMSSEDKERVWAECKNNTSPRADFCNNIRELQKQSN